MARFIDISAFRFPPKGWMVALCWVFIVARLHRAQVKVVNGGFESFLSLPTASGQLGLLPGWSNGGSDAANPDFYHEQGENGGDLPQTPLAMVNPHTGRGIAGFVAYTDDFNPQHEYITGSSPSRWRPRHATSSLSTFRPDKFMIGSMRDWE